jgi:hypothetical protein
MRPRAEAWPARRDGSEVRVGATWNGWSESRDRLATEWVAGRNAPPEGDTDWFPEYSREADVPKIEYFHATRTLDTDSDQSELLPGKQEGARRLTRSARKYVWIRHFLANQEAARANSLKASLRDQGLVVAGEPIHEDGFARNLATLTDSLQSVGLRRRERVEAMFARPDGGEVELDALTDSERMLVLYASTVEAFGLYSSVILIDTPEVAIHPADQADVLRRWSAMTPDAQLIVATTSAGILRDAPAGSVIVL